ncbi:MAG: pyridoxamine 5'-phosphate oxidase family protein [Deferrisomatales bacterium]|nr:pyridoxamine 5'-phosphate oxidase family protein [Deferrisomatales bacterium]
MTRSLPASLEGKTAYLATADEGGVPHLAVGEVEGQASGGVLFRGWLCPRTLANLDANRRVALAVGLGPDGVQLVGTVEEKSVDAVLDGYGLASEDVPQVRYRLVVRPAEALRMTDRAHTDRPLP